MCTGILHVDPDAPWPVLLAFVRDEDRARPTRAPGRWWPDSPQRIGGQDELGGGTWLAVDTGDAPQLAFVQNRRDREASPVPAAVRISRGTLPGRALDAGTLVISDDELARLDPFVLVLAGVEEPPRWWNWDGERLGSGIAQAGWHFVTSHGIDRPELSARHRTWLPRFASATRPHPRAAATPTAEAWGRWIDLLDGRAATMGDERSIVIAGVPDHPGFGTVGASLVALGHGEVRYDRNPSHVLDPGSWEQVDLGASAQARAG